MKSVSELTYSKETDSGRSRENQNVPGLKASKTAILVFKVLLYVLPLLLAGDITTAVSFSKCAELGSRQELQNLGEFVAAIKAQGNLVRVENTRDYTLFPDVGNRKTVRIGSERIQVIVFKHKEAANGAAISVSPDGFSVTDAYLEGMEPTRITNIGWIDWPHFYKSGSLVAVYIGHNAAMKKLLTSIMGPQFAGM
jgi:hypothetical protein